MTKSGRPVWQMRALAKIHAYYDKVLSDLSINDATRALRYLLKMLENMKCLDTENGSGQAPAGRRST
jgi:hypothetical protein